MGGANTTEKQRTLPSEALISFLDNGLNYNPPAIQSCTSPFIDPSYAGDSNTSVYSSVPGSFDSIYGFADSYELSSVEEPPSMENFASTPELTFSGLLQQSPSNEIVCCSDDELSASMSPPTQPPLFEKEGMENETSDRTNYVMSESFEQFLERSVNSLFYHHGYSHSF